MSKFRFSSFRSMATVLAAFVVVLLVPWPGHAQTAEEGGTGRLEVIEATGSARFTSAQIAASTGLHVGEAVTRADLQKAADTLAQLGPFKDVRYRFSSTGTGVEADYQVTDVAGIPVAFDNFAWYSDDNLTTALKKAVPLFDSKAPESGAVLDEISAALQNLIAKAGLNETVSHSVVTDPFSGAPVQEFRVDDAGLTVQSVEFSDALAKNDRAVQDRVHDLIGKPYSRDTAELFEFEQVRPLYLRHGFLQVQFDPPVVHLEGGSGTTLPNKVDIVVPIGPGPAFTWQGVKWSGDTAIPPADLDKLTAMKPGDLADGNKIQAVWNSVQQEYADRGYLDATVSATPKFDEANKSVSYSASIVEGPLYHMGNLVLSGLSMEGERRIRTAWKISPDAVFDLSTYNDFLNTGIKQAFVGLPFHYQDIQKYLQKDAATGKVDVMLNFE